MVKVPRLLLLEGWQEKGKEEKGKSKCHKSLPRPQQHSYVSVSDVPFWVHLNVNNDTGNANFMHDVITIIKEENNSFVWMTRLRFG